MEGREKIREGKIFSYKWEELIGGEKCNYGEMGGANEEKEG